MQISGFGIQNLEFRIRNCEVVEMKSEPFGPSYLATQILIRWSKLNHISHIKQFELPVYKLTVDFIHFVVCKTKILPMSSIMKVDRNPSIQMEKFDSQCIASTVTMNPHQIKFAGLTSKVLGYV